MKDVVVIAAIGGASGVIAAITFAFAITAINAATKARKKPPAASSAPSHLSVVPK